MKIKVLGPSALVAVVVFGGAAPAFAHVTTDPDSAPKGGEITLTTGYRPGVKFGAGIAGERVSLPLEVTVRDNGSGVPTDLLPYIFDPFVTTKVHGSGLGLALVAKIVGDRPHISSAGTVDAQPCVGAVYFQQSELVNVYRDRRQLLPRH